MHEESKKLQNDWDRSLAGYLFSYLEDLRDQFGTVLPTFEMLCYLDDYPEYYSPFIVTVSTASAWQSGLWIVQFHVVYSTVVRIVTYSVLEPSTVPGILQLLKGKPLRKQSGLHLGLGLIWEKKATDRAWRFKCLMPDCLLHLSCWEFNVVMEIMKLDVIAASMNEMRRKINREINKLSSITIRCPIQAQGIVVIDAWNSDPEGMRALNRVYRGLIMEDWMLCRSHPMEQPQGL